MNKGLPNITKLSLKALLSGLGVTSWVGWILQRVLFYYGNKGTQKVLIVADKGHVAFIIRRDGEKFDSELDNAYEIVDSGKVLTQEEKDAIDQPVMDAFRKLATFRVQHNNKN